MGEQNNNKKTTLNDVLSSVNTLSEKVNTLSKKVNTLSETVNDLAEAVNIFATKTEERFDKLEDSLDGVEGEIGSIKSQMVTKDYLDRKMAEQRGDMMILLRKEDTKVKTVVEILADKKVFTPEDKNKVMGMEPFAQLAV